MKTFFGGDRAHDLGLMLMQEIRILPSQAGYAIMHTWGKAHRLNRPNVFSIYKNPDEILCPVIGLDVYLWIARELGIPYI